MINYKVRCYDPETKRMLFSEDPNVIFTVGTDGKMSVKVRSEGKPDRFIINPVVSLYTGATDKNGKRIYENDLASYQDTYTCIIKVYLATGLDTTKHNDEIAVIGNISEGEK